MSHHGGVRPGAGKGRPTGQSSTVRDRMRLFEPHDQSSIQPPRGWVPGAKQTNEGDSSSFASPSARVHSSSPSPGSSGRNSASGQSSPGPPLMIDETGQKEREMLDASSLQGQSDDSLQDESLFQQLTSLEEQNQKLQQKIVETEKEKERLKAILDSQDGARNCYSPDIGPGGKVLPSRVLDGRAVLKDRDRADSVDPGNVREEHQHVSFGDRSTPTSPLERGVDPDKDLLAQVKSLLKERKLLESRLRDMKETNHTLQREVTVQRDSIAKTHDLTSDLKKDVDLLRSENSKLMSALRKTEKERDGLQVEKQELQGKFSVCENKLMQVEKFYLEAEHQNQSLEEELAAIVSSRDHLSEEKQKLDQEVHNALKTKDNFRLTIRKLREQNTSLETKMSSMLREKEVMEKREEHMKREEQYKEGKLQETRMEVQGLKSETKVLKEKLSLVEREKSTLMAKCEQIDVSEHQLKQQLEETKWEREELKQRLTNISQSERRLRERQDKVLKEIDSCSRELRQKIPGVKSDDKSSPVRHGSGWSSCSETPAEISSLKALHADIISEMAVVQDQRKLLEVKVSQIESLLQTREEELNKVNEERRKLSGELSAQQAKWKEELRKLEVEWQEKVDSTKLLQQSLGKERDKLLAEMVSLRDRISEISVENEELSRSKGRLEAQLAEKDATLVSTQRQLAHLIVEKACSTAQLTLSLAQGVKTEEGEPRGNEPATMIVDTSAKIKQLSSQISVITKERDDLRQQLQELSDKHSSTLQEYQQCAESNSKWGLETEKVKLQYSTDLRILQSKVDKLEADKANLEKSIADMESKQPAGSAFQPVHIPTSQSTHPRKVTFDPLQEKSQQQIIELQHKVTMLEAENKRLQDMTYSNTSSIEVENSLRRKLLQMRRENIRLDTRRKQLEERVGNLQSSLKAAKETHDRSTHERIKTMQEDNSALQDRIRSMEDMLSRKLMEADTRMSVVVKENDMLRHKLSHLHNGLETVEGLRVSLEGMSSLLQRQDQILAVLKSELDWKSDSEPTGTLTESLDKISEMHNEIQTLLTMQTTQEVSGKAATLSHHTASTSQVLPPVLKQLPAEYVSNLQGKGSRPRSASAFTPILQVREKVSQLHMENLAVSQTIRRQLEARQLGEKEVVELGQKISSLQQEVQTSVKQLQEAHKELAALNSSDLSPEQLNCIFILEKQVETWQDKVIDRDMALRDIEVQMREDFESHDQKFSLLRSQLLALQEELSSKGELLLARDQFIQETEDRCVNAESEVVKLRKEVERAMQEVLNVPEGFQLSSHNRNISELVHAQNEEMQRINGMYQEQVFQLNQLRSKLDAIHRENSILQHQNLEAEKHHQQICQELHTERDFLRQINLQLIEQQVKAEDAGELLKIIKRSQETLREQRDIHKLRIELDGAQVKIREQELRISELQHQLYAYEQQTMKLMQAHQAVPPEVMVMPPYKQFNHQMQARHTGHRPRSASAADSVPRNYKTLPGYNDIKARNRTQAPHALEGDFTIPFPSTSYGENVLNLNDQSDSGCKPGQYVVGLPVVTDDEGANTVTEAEDSSPKHQRSKWRRHRRTASTGSNSFQDFPEPAADQDSNTKTPMNFNPSSATLPISMAKPRGGKVFSKRPGSADSTRFDLQEKIGQYAQNIKDKIEEMTNHHEVDEEQSQASPMEDTTHPPISQAKGNEAPSAAKPELKPPTQTRSRRGIGIAAPWFIRGKGKSANKSSTETASTAATGSDSAHQETQAKSRNHPGLSNLSIDHSSFASMKADDASSNGGSSAQVSRMSSLTSRSDSFASSASTTFSGVGGESSPYSTLSNDSLLADSIESLQHLALTSTGPAEMRLFPRGPYSTPIVPQSYNMSSSSDEEGRYVGSARKRTTLERAAPVNSFRPLNLPTHHRTTSSCDSDILQPSPATANYSHITIPLCRNESISLSDMEKYSTDHEDVQEKISYLQNKLSKTRRSSTGSITIFNSGSSMEDINKSGD